MPNHIPPAFGELKNGEKMKKGVLRIQCKKEVCNFYLSI